MTIQQKQYFFRYNAVCKACGYVMKSDTERTWLSPFFLPSNCCGCGKYHNRYATWSSDSKIVEVRYVFQKKPFQWCKPSTWSGEWVIDPETEQ